MYNKWTRKINPKTKITYNFIKILHFQLSNLILQNLKEIIPKSVIYFLFPRFFLLYSTNLKNNNKTQALPQSKHRLFNT